MSRIAIPSVKDQMDMADRIKSTVKALTPATPSEILDARRHARTLRSFYSTHDRGLLQPLVRTAIILGEEVDRLRETLDLCFRIAEEIERKPTP